MLVGIAGLAACQTTAPTPLVTTADKFAPLAINARRLEIIDNWQMTVEAPYVGHRAQTSPSNLLADWAAQVLLTLLAITRKALSRQPLALA